MALGDERRAIGRDNESSRRAIGTAIEEERRAIGRNIEAERRGSEVVDEINSLVKPQTTRTTLRTVPPVGSIPAQRGTGTYKPTATTSGGGIASPVTETPNTREHYEPQAVWSSDGLVALMLGQIKTLHMTDANDAEVVFEFQNVLPE